MRYAERPLLIYWELTRACDLACRHCRAEAIPQRDPRELSTEEGFALLERLTAFGDPRPHLVLTGGDPLKRPDLFDLIAEARRLGFLVALTPSGTYALTEAVIDRLKAAGIWMLALSLDGSTATRHDALRGVPGSFARPCGRPAGRRRPGCLSRSTPWCAPRPWRISRPWWSG